MDGNTPQESTSSPVLHGEGQSTKFKSLDLADPKDVALLRSSVKRRWPGLDEDSRAEAVKCLKAAMAGARSEGDLRLMLEAVKTHAALEAQHQTDDLMADKNFRLDAGKLTEAVKLYAAGSDTEAV